ncbi:MAG TPA: hypothetical protein VHU84_10470, partial [Lacipirellulaceae bacterium]|nr:hypothetical protein [Lacipirellulaceae bacterium]
MKDAKSRELATSEVIETDLPPFAEDLNAEQTVEDFSSMKTWAGDSEDDNDAHIAKNVESEPAQIRLAQHMEDAEPSETHDLDLAGLDASVDADDLDFNKALSETPTTSPVAHVEEQDAAELHLAKMDEAETVGFESLQTETPEEAAQRIDAWFRSAQTLAEVPPITESSPVAETAAEHDAEPETAADLGLISGSANDATGDYELDVPSEDAQNVPPWD